MLLLFKIWKETTANTRRKKRHFYYRHRRRRTRTVVVAARDYRQFRPKHLHAHEKRKKNIKKSKRKKTQNKKKKKTENRSGKRDASSTGFLLETKLFAEANMKSTFMFMCYSSVSTRVVVVVVVERKQPCACAEEFRWELEHTRKRVRKNCPSSFFAPSLSLFSCLKTGARAFDYMLVNKFR